MSRIRSIVVLVTSGVFALSMVPSARSATSEHAQKLDRQRLGSGTIAPTRDTVRSGRPSSLRSTRLRGYGGYYRASTGELVKIVMSDRYVPDDAVNQSWANFIAGLIHSSEIARVTIYIAPYDEMQSYCSPEANACYYPQLETIVASGNTPPDGTSLEDTAAHEYGHHVAANRDNYPWDAFTWGPKYWSSYESICQRVTFGNAFPGDEGVNYTLNPGEAWAETYRVLNGGSWTGLVDQSFAPDATDLAQARADVVQPWTGAINETKSGTFTRSRRKARYYAFNTDDGIVRATLSAPKGSAFDLRVYGISASQSTGGARVKQVRYRVCGDRPVRVRVSRRKGFGGYKLTVAVP